MSWSTSSTAVSDTRPDDGHLAEILLNTAKHGTAVDTNARDAAVAASLAAAARSSDRNLAPRPYTQCRRLCIGTTRPCARPVGRSMKRHALAEEAIQRAVFERLHFLYRRQTRRERVTRVRRAEQVALRVGKHQAVSQIKGECSR
jgi:hypothetical protein